MTANRSDGVETRKRLIDAAESVFALRGFHDTKVAEICRLAKANIAAVNYHFGSKEELYVEAWRHAFKRSIEKHPPAGGVSAGAPAEDRLRGQILALIRRIMDPASLDFDIVHKEMANPTGLLSEVMSRSIEPLRQQSLTVVRELLGTEATEQQVRLCEISIHAQCFGPLMHERHRRNLPKGRKRMEPYAKEIECSVLSEHVFRFSLAGIREVRGRYEPSLQTKPYLP
jgi:TetR/AcrR family transcriptional regulator, regulator of cefoperazone and chloramphenicol sensitivity